MGERREVTTARSRDLAGSSKLEAVERAREGRFNAVS
jgi:hypothetical protein